MSINVRLNSPGSDPVLVAGLAAVARGFVTVSGPATIAGSADGRIRLESLSGSIRVVDVDVAPEVPLSVGSNSGSIFLENITLAVSGSLRADRAVSVKDLHGAFFSFNIWTQSGLISVSEVSRSGAPTSATDVLLVSLSVGTNSGSIFLEVQTLLGRI
ncbi:hypothetical protein HK405_015778 [Cladochytrium tenue]|nr:hypothetical protein HK405_015778 [Cladochytrium tenue]